MAKESMLEDFEIKTIVPMVVETLNHKIGKHNALKGHRLCSWLLACGHDINPGRFRLIINYIRSNDLVIGLVAGSKGYYRTDDPVVIQKWIEKEIGIIRQKSIPLKRMRLYLHELANTPNLSMK